MEGHLIGVTKTHDDYTWRSIGNATKEHTSCMWNVARDSNLNFTRPHPGMVLWIRTKCVHQNAPADQQMALRWPS